MRSTQKHYSIERLEDWRTDTTPENPLSHFWCRDQDLMGTSFGTSVNQLILPEKPSLTFLVP